MDIGNQQRVIIVELDQVEEPGKLTEVEAAVKTDLETAVTWPLPLDLETVG